MLVSIVVYAISFLLTRALSRYRELAGRPLGGHPDRASVGAGLGPGQGDRRDVADPDARPALGRGLQRLLLHPRLTQGRRDLPLVALFDPPPLERRLAQLAELEAQLGQTP
jgi:heat shock protein HtpX